MEKRPNCYNYIFSKCMVGDRCPLGHVIVHDKVEYMRRHENTLNQSEYEDKFIHSNMHHRNKNKGQSRRSKNNKSFIYNYQEL